MIDTLYQVHPYAKMAWSVLSAAHKVRRSRLQISPAILTLEIARVFQDCPRTEGPRQQHSTTLRDYRQHLRHCEQGNSPPDPISQTGHCVYDAADNRLRLFHLFICQEQGFLYVAHPVFKTSSLTARFFCQGSEPRRISCQVQMRK